MNKKVNKIIKQKLNYKKELQNRLPEETCNKIWEKIHQRLTSFYEEYKDLPKRIASHTDTFIFPAVDCYAGPPIAPIFMRKQTRKKYL